MVFQEGHCQKKTCSQMSSEVQALGKIFAFHVEPPRGPKLPENLSLRKMSVRSLVRNTVVPSLSTVMSRLWRDISLVLTSVGQKFQQISQWAPRSRPSWQKGKAPERDGIRFFRAPGLLRHFWSSYRVTVKSKCLPRCQDLTWVTSGCQKFELIIQWGTWKSTDLAEGRVHQRDGIRFFRAP